MARIVRLRLAVPGTVIQVNVGDTIRVDAGFTYVGPAWRETLYGVLYTGVEDEISGSAGTSAIDVPATPQPTPVSGSYVFLPVPNRPGETFGILMKLGNIAKDKVPSVVQITAPPTVPQFANFKIYKYTAKPWLGSTCYVHVMYDYQGPATSRQLRAAIGNIMWYGFDEMLSGITTIQIPAALSWQLRLAVVEIPIPMNARLGVYDLYAKIDSILSPYYLNVIEIIE